MKDTPRTDAKMFPAWRWDTHKMEYVPHGIGFPAGEARKLERELTAARKELAELEAEYGTWWAQKRIAIDELKEVTEQRDEARRLAERYRDLACDTLEEADETLLPWEITTSNEL